MSAGIYQIMNQINGHRYIGSAINIRKRWQNHLSDLRHRRHCNRHLQRAFDKYGGGAFVFEIIERLKPKDLIEREQHYLNTLSPEYNIAPVAGSSLGLRRSLETCKKMSKAVSGERHPMYGKHRSEKTRRKISNTKKGQYPSEIARAKMREVNRGERNPFYGRCHTEQTRKQMSEAHKGKRHSEETRAKLRAAWTPKRRQEQGNRMRSRFVSKETRRHLSEALIGRQLSDEHRRKMSEAHKGKRHSMETRAKISKACKAYWHRVQAHNS